MIVDQSLIETHSNSSVVVNLEQFHHKKFKLTISETAFIIEEWSKNKWIETDCDPGFPIVHSHYKIVQSHPLSIFQNFLYDKRTDGINYYYHLQASLLRCISSNYYAEQIYRDNPVLLWIIINHFGTNNLNKLLEKRRTEILSEICGHSEKKHISFIRKLRPTSGYQSEIKTVIDSLSRQEIISEFTHWKTVPIQAIAISLQNPILLGSKILRALENTNQDEFQEQAKSITSSIHVFIECIRIGKAIGFKSPENILANIPTTNRLFEIHDKWTQILNRQSKYLEHDENLPFCPLKNDKTITHISTVNELIKEGKEMEHCVGSYIEKSKNKSCYIFKITNPERATLEISKGKNEFRIAQIKGRHNTSVSDETVLYVKNWLDTENATIFGK
jgi:hypothetical protein